MFSYPNLYHDNTTAAEFLLQIDSKLCLKISTISRRPRRPKQLQPPQPPPQPAPQPAAYVSLLASFSLDAPSAHDRITAEMKQMDTTSAHRRSNKLPKPWKFVLLLAVPPCKLATWIQALTIYYLVRLKLCCSCLLV